MLVRLLLALTAFLPLQQPAQPDATAGLVVRLERAAAARDRSAVLMLASADAQGSPLDEFADALTASGPTRVVVKDRDQATIAGGGHRVLLEVFAERGVEGLLSTWMMDVRPAAGVPLPVITAVKRVSVVSGLFRLSLDTGKEFAVRNLTLRAPDLTLEMSSGSAFMASTPEGPTAVVLIGRGRMRFTPPDVSERSQVRIFSGDDELSSEFDAAFIRIRPSEFATFFPPAALQSREVDPQDVRKATDVFDDYIGRTLQLDLSDLSRDRWSLAPSGDDIIAEVRTRKFGTLTYARSGGDAEDIALFDRRRRRNIAVYASEQKLAQRGRFYSEDDLVNYDVLNYDLDVAITPDRLTIEGVARLTLKIRGNSTPTLNLRLAESLLVRSVVSPQFGRLLHLRVVGQNSLIVNLPGTVVEGTEFTLRVAYGGKLASQSLDREAISFRQELRENFIPLEPHYIYSNRSYWYPQSVVSDYAPARMRINVPSEYDVIATGEPSQLTAPPPGVREPGQRDRHVFVFNATEPVRYLSCVISRFSDVAATTVAIGDASQEGAIRGDSSEENDLSLFVHANPRLTGRSRNISADAASIIRFYASLVGGAPYQAFSIAVTENDRPGGHSPPYFAVLNQIIGPFDNVWRNDPVSFENYPLFFLAHEIAHQWWGHAVGWKNYHEQWVSEGFAQYFAALYAERSREDNVLPNLLRQMRHTAIDASAQGPIYLGYRLGHIRADDRVFRAVIYNKGAMVLHMLRRLIGDEAFFGGVRTFYEEWKFRKAGTDDFRKVMEEASGRDLTRFFEAWIFGAQIPEVKFGYEVRGQELDVRFEVREPVDVALTVSIAYTSGQVDDVIVTMSEKTTAVTLPLKGAVRTVTANADNGALVEIRR
jgi:hypothetical protein